MSENLTILEFAVADLNNLHTELSYGPVKLSSVIYLLRLIFYHVMIVSLQFLPGFVIVVMIGVEAFCLSLGIYLMTKHNYLREKRVVIHRSIQNAAIIFFLIHAMVIVCGQYKFDAEVGSAVQFVAMWTIVFSIVIEYIFMLTCIVTFIY